MFKNYYLFKKQTEEIAPQIINSVVYAVYTVHKNELIFDLKRLQDNKQLIISIDANRPYIFLSDFKNYKTDKLAIFETLYGEEIKSFEIAHNSKYIFLQFNTHEVHSFFFGPKPNILLYSFEKQLIDTFKSKDNKDLPQIPDLKGDLTEGYLNKLSGLSEKEDLAHWIKMILPAANNRMTAEIFFRYKSASNDHKDLNQGFYEIISKFKSELESGKVYIYQRKHQDIYLLLYKSQPLLQDSYTFDEFDSINKAWQVFVSQRERVIVENKLFNQVSNVIQRRRKALETALQNLQEAENIEERKKLADLTGNLLLTNKHKIPRGVDKVNLVNIFSADQEVLTIKLNPKKTTVENANHYFGKYKNSAEKRQLLELKRATYQKDYEGIYQLDEKRHNATVKDLIKIKETLINMNLLQDEAKKKQNPESLKFSFKRLILENKWDIYIGKNNVNNELLTFTFANKSDLWFHAQGVPGSHVLVRVPKKNTSVPKNIIDQAAQLAAANSKARHSSTVSVIYTEVRHLSKVRKALPGTVNVRNEKVIFVKPLNLNQ